MNATRVKKVKKYFKSISPHLFEKMVEQTNYHLYNYTDNEKPVFLVPRHIHNLVSKMKKMVEIQHCAISIGFFKATRTRAGFDERFYLSYEGGRFLYDLIEKKFPEIQKEIFTAKLDKKGEKTFLYGTDVSLKHVINQTGHLHKFKLIFVQSRKEEYLGIALLKVKMIGEREYNKKMKYVNEYSRSDNFIVSLMNLADPGYYIREGY